MQPPGCGGFANWITSDDVGHPGGAAGGHRLDHCSDPGCKGVANRITSDDAGHPGGGAGGSAAVEAGLREEVVVPEAARFAALKSATLPQQLRNPVVLGLAAYFTVSVFVLQLYLGAAPPARQNPPSSSLHSHTARRLVPHGASAHTC